MGVVTRIGWVEWTSALSEWRFQRASVLLGVMFLLAAQWGSGSCLCLLHSGGVGHVSACCTVGEWVMSLLAAQWEWVMSLLAAQWGSGSCLCLLHSGSGSCLCLLHSGGVGHVSACCTVGVCWPVPQVTARPSCGGLPRASAQPHCQITSNRVSAPQRGREGWAVEGCSEGLPGLCSMGLQLALWR